MILELRLLPQDKQEEIKAFYNSSLENDTLLPPFEQFNEFGLKYPTEHLANIGKFAIFFPVEMMVNYVDETTKNFVNSDIDSYECFLNKAILNTDINEKNINTTSIGNLAYCYLYSKNENLKKNAKKLLDLIHSEMEKIIMKEVSKNKC